MIPAHALKTIRSVTIHYKKCISGFSFFDKRGARLWQIGWIDQSHRAEKVVLEENEVIVGVVAKLYQGYQSAYTDFQFVIAGKLD
jgi:hypothetical protein